MAAALLRVVAADLGVPVTVTSAGLLEGGRPGSADVVAAMAPYGVELSGHRSTSLTASAVEEADLILGLERRHCREAVLLVPPALGRTFTLKELVRRGETTGPRPPGERLERWLARVGAGRERTDLIGRSPQDDVADPLGGDRSTYRATAAELDGLVRRLARLLWTRGDDVPIEP